MSTFCCLRQECHHRNFLREQLHLLSEHRSRSLQPSVQNTFALCPRPPFFDLLGVFFNLSIVFSLRLPLSFGTSAVFITCSFAFPFGLAFADCSNDHVNLASCVPRLLRSYETLESPNYFSCSLYRFPLDAIWDVLETAATIPRLALLS